MARSKPSPEEQERIYTLHRQVKDYFEETWQTEWQKHGQTFNGFDQIYNKNAFYEAVESTIEEKLVKKYGSVEGNEKSISKDSIRRFLKNEKGKGYDTKVLNGFLILIGEEDDWDAYKQVSFNPSTRKIKTGKNLKKYLLLGGVILSFLFVYFFDWNYFEPARTLVEKPEITVELNEPTNGVPPRQIIVHYDLKTENYLQGAFIEYLSKRYYLDKINGDTTLTTPNPNFWSVNLSLGREILDTKKILIPSSKWSGYLNHRFPLNESDFLSNKGELHLHQAEKMLKPPGEFYTTFNYFKDFEQNGNNFVLRAKIKNPPVDKNQWAYDISVDVIGYDSNLTFNLLSPDALEYVCLKVADTDFVKKYPLDRLSKLGTIVEEYKDLTVRCKDNRIQIVLGKTVLIDESYTGEIGQIMGLQFLFKGAGYVKDVTLNGKPV